MLILKQLNEEEKSSNSKGCFNINEFYMPFLVIMIIYYLLINNKSNLCSNCAQSLQILPQQPTRYANDYAQLQQPQQRFQHNLQQLQYNPY